MALEHMFEDGRPGLAERRARLEAAVSRQPAPRPDGRRSVLGDGPLAEHSREPVVDDAVPVLGALAGLLPTGLRRGEAVSVASAGREVDYLTLSLLAGALAAGLWCAAVGTPDLGGAALAEMLADCPDGSDALDRLLLAPEPGEQWARAAVELASGVDLVLVRPPGAVDAAEGRRVDARLRHGRSAGIEHAAALVVLGPWASSRLSLRTERTEWLGLDGQGASAGTGHLRGGIATVSAQGRATGGRRREAQLWLPTAPGSVAALDVRPGISEKRDHRGRVVAA